jgi:hypothetical protein
MYMYIYVYIYIYIHIYVYVYVCLLRRSKVQENCLLLRCCVVVQASTHASKIVARHMYTSKLYRICSDHRYI